MAACPLPSCSESLERAEPSTDRPSGPRCQRLDRVTAHRRARAASSLPSLRRGGMPAGGHVRAVGPRDAVAAGARAARRWRARRARHDRGAPLSVPPLQRHDHGRAAGRRSATALRRNGDRSGSSARRHCRCSAHRGAAACQPLVCQLRCRQLGDRAALVMRHRPEAPLSVGPPQSPRFFAAAASRAGRDDARRDGAICRRRPRGRRHGRRRAGCVMASGVLAGLMSGPTRLDPRSAERLALGWLCGRCGVTGAERTRRARPPQAQGPRGSGGALSQ
ncbi:uncharacterized protein SOCEGT47_084100 [Sorangium cellulosum]|uniref:Uncharacterized protein n=1 Tax=Sorangium cellulosum TaxID=56 RepID=A0A4P2Q640_SORCE|nr:uncharacterized protein SOCEGT47_020050 [Sorangium cellulosum]AUX24885.1 uncharacterized protein SOCEGT47_054250 [Sorangium cellulosum]AUX27013.1 uncharacterized protein SOCEGT47_075860 [Sorangium cellulosum]AUX27812.1 uncharacterized protein SOCEGT47_084100 [Sorangium cellulosum]